MVKMKTLEKLDSNDLKVIEEWLIEKKDEIPTQLLNFSEHYCALISAFNDSQNSLRKTLKQLRLALGIEPKSERKKSGNPLKTPKNFKEKYLLSIEKTDAIIKWHRKLLRAYNKKKKDLSLKLAKIEEIELTQEEEIEIGRENEAYLERLSSGEADPSYVSANEILMNGAIVQNEQDEVEVELDKSEIVGNQDGPSFFEDRIRYGFSLNVTEIEYKVENMPVIDANGERSVITASTWEYGPPRMKITWEFLSNFIILSAQYCIPFNRIARMLTTEVQGFQGGELSRYFRYAANRLLPVYIQLAKDLANTDIFSGDDTSIRVLEINRAQKTLSENKDFEVPWSHFKTKELAISTDKKDESFVLGVKTAAHLGFVSNYRNSTENFKQKFHSTVVHGRSEFSDPSSLIVFFRSHFGSFANLVERLLEFRDVKNKSILIQSDLANTNLIKNDKFDIDQAGCVSHARRPFAIYEDRDPDNNAYLLELFRGLYLYEKGLSLSGRSKEKILAVRDKDCRPLWIEIKNICQEMIQKWPAKDELGAAARYVVNHYQELTLYLDDAKLSISNDLSERMLRLEKLIQDNALFRQTLEGRFSLDIIRTIIQTATASQVNISDYLNFVFRINDEELEKNPQKYTPRSYSKFISQNNLA